MPGRNHVNAPPKKQREPDPQQLVSLAYAASWADLTAPAIRRRQLSGELTTYRLGRTVRVDLAELKALMASGDAR